MEFCVKDFGKHEKLNRPQKHHRQTAAAHASRLHRPTDDGPCTRGYDHRQKITRPKVADSWRLCLPPVLHPEIRGDSLPSDHDARASERLRFTPDE